VGAVLVLLGLAHLVLPRGLAWGPEFTALRPLTRRIVYVHTFFIGLTCAVLGLAPLVLADDLLAPGTLPVAVLGAECAFWAVRWAAQFVTFPPALWRHSPVYRLGYAGFALLWTWVVAVFAVALYRSLLR
jgi:hypothetical protein